MNLLETWKLKYLSGNEKLDSQHVELLETIQEIRKSGDTTQLTKLIRLLTEHHTYEESEIIRCYLSYTELREQIQDHHQLINTGRKLLGIKNPVATLRYLNSLEAHMLCPSELKVIECIRKNLNS